MIKKTLIYFFYCNDQWTDVPEVFQLHLRLLKPNINIFNEYKFILAFNDPNNIKFVNKYKKLIIDYLELKKKNPEFIIVQNDPYSREGTYFFKEVVLKLNEYDGLIFWGHNKSDFNYNKKNIYKWIFACHFINFYDIKDVEEKLTYDKYVAYGALPIKLMIPFGIHTREEKFYDGSFFWINPRKMYNLHKNNYYDFTNYYNFYFNKEFMDKYNIKTQFGPMKYITESFFDQICCFNDECTTLNGLRNLIRAYVFATQNNTTLVINYSGYSIEDSVENSNILTQQQIEEYHKYINDISQELNIKYN